MLSFVTDICVDPEILAPNAKDSKSLHPPDTFVSADQVWYEPSAPAKECLRRIVPLCGQWASRVGTRSSITDQSNRSQCARGAQASPHFVPMWAPWQPRLQSPSRYYCLLSGTAQSVYLASWHVLLLLMIIYPSYSEQLCKSNACSCT